MAVEVGYHEARVSRLRPVLDPDDDPSGAVPRACAVRNFGEQPSLRPGRLEAIFGDLARLLDLKFEHRIARQLHEAPNVVSLAPIEHPVRRHQREAQEESDQVRDRRPLELGEPVADIAGDKGPDGSEPMDLIADGPGERAYARQCPIATNSRRATTRGTRQAAGARNARRRGRRSTHTPRGSRPDAPVPPGPRGSGWRARRRYGVLQSLLRNPETALRLGSINRPVSAFQYGTHPTARRSREIRRVARNLQRRAAFIPIETLSPIVIFEDFDLWRFSDPHSGRRLELRDGSSSVSFSVENVPATRAPNGPRNAELQFGRSLGRLLSCVRIPGDLVRQLFLVQHD